MLVDEWFLLEIKNDEKLAEKKKTAGNKNFQGFKKKKKVKKMSRVQTSISKSNDEIQFLNDAIQVQFRPQLVDTLFIVRLRPSMPMRRPVVINY